MQIACPACHTRYTVPDTAIGAQGRTVRCAKCRHSWYQPGHDEVADTAEEASAAQPAEAAVPEPAAQAAEPAAQRAEPVAEAVVADGDWADGNWSDGDRHAPPPTPRGWADHTDSRVTDPTDDADARSFAAPPAEETVEPEPLIEEEPAPEGVRPAFATSGAEPVDAEYEDLDRPEHAPRWKRLLLICGILLVLAAALIYGAVRYFGAPAWLPVGQTTFAPASEALVLDFPAEEQDRRELPNGRQLFAASGTITNTGSRTEHVPPVLVVLRDSQERIVYSWEMEPSQKELGPGESVKVSQMVTDVPRSARIVDIGWKPG